MALYSLPAERVCHLLCGNTSWRGLYNWSFAAVLAFASPLTSPVPPAQALPEFEIADVHVSPIDGERRGVLRMMEEGKVSAGRYEIYNATMLDLIRTAYSIEADAVLGGPSWVALDRFDVIAKVPATTTAAVNVMLQSLLGDRFKLLARKDTRPMPAWVLSAGTDKPKFKPADSSGESGCRVVDNNERLSCHNINMDAFVAWLRAGRLTTLPVVNSTGIKESWDFDLHYTIAGGMTGISENNPILDAIDKQLGLKLDLQYIPQAVLVVESVNRNPTANAPGVEKELGVLDKFEVASIRPCQTFDLFEARYSASGQVTTGCRSLSYHVMMAWNRCTQVQAAPNAVVALCSDNVVGAPKWISSRYFNIVAKAPVAVDGWRDPNYRAMLRNLLVKRFKMITHYEDRLVDVYTLVALKPKLRKADLSSRTTCKSSGTLIGIPTLVTCQNVTMARFAEELNHHMPIVASGRPVVDASGIEGTWDITFSYSVAAAANASNVTGVASDPSGKVSLFDAIEQQLGLKLREAKNRMPVFVIDHIEQKPTDN